MPDIKNKVQEYHELSLQSGSLSEYFQNGDMIKTPTTIIRANKQLHQQKHNLKKEILTEQNKNIKTKRASIDSQSDDKYPVLDVKAFALLNQTLEGNGFTRRMRHSN